MTIAAWSIVWQIVAASACLLFFGLAVFITAGAVREARDMLRDLSDSNTKDP